MLDSNGVPIVVDGAKGGDSFPTPCATCLNATPKINLAEMPVLFSSVMASAEATSPGVGQRVSAGDFQALMGGFFATFGLSLTAHQKCRVNPPPSILNDWAQSIKTCSEAVALTAAAVRKNVPAVSFVKDARPVKSSDAKKEGSSSTSKKKEGKEPSATSSKTTGPSTKDVPRGPVVDLPLEEMNRKGILKKVLRTMRAKKSPGKDAAFELGFSEDSLTKRVNELTSEQIKDVHMRMSMRQPALEALGIFDEIASDSSKVPNGWSADTHYTEWLDRIKEFHTQFDKVKGRTEEIIEVSKKSLAHNTSFDKTFKANVRDKETGTLKPVVLSFSEDKNKASCFAHYAREYVVKDFALAPECNKEVKDLLNSPVDSVHHQVDGDGRQINIIWGDQHRKVVRLYSTVLKSPSGRPELVRFSNVRSDPPKEVPGPSTSTSNSVQVQPDQSRGAIPKTKPVAIERSQGKITPDLPRPANKKKR
jgi:DNA-binding Lrp family transcriptional regulator